MFDLSSKKIEKSKSNLIIKKNINLDNDLDCFILISTEDENFSELLLNKILDSIIDKISIKNTYNDFSLSLENINSFINNWKRDKSEKLSLDTIIWVLNKNSFIFSNIWNSSCYLVKKDLEILEVTKSDDNRKEFSFISSWDLSDWEIIVLSTKRLLNYLSNSDIIDGLNSADIKWFNKNIKNILLEENIEKNILVTCFRYNSFKKESEGKIKHLNLFKDNFIKIFDNKISKRVYAFFLKQKDNLKKQSKIVRNSILAIWILFCVIILYTSISNIVWVTSNSQNLEINKENIIKARELVRTASESINNKDIFDKNIKEAENIVDDIKSQNLFLNDIEKITEDINIIKKQFNKVEIFSENEKNLILAWDFKDAIKIIKSNSKTYILKEKWVVWPIIPWQEAKENIFDKLDNDEVFIDWVSIWEDIYLLTNMSKVVNLSKSGYFSYSDVEWQEKWENSKQIATFWQNIYLLSKDNSQIYKHSKSSNKFLSWEWYIIEEDLNSIWNILSISIDWWFYILKNDLSLVKLFKNPEYSIENLIINSLPENYEIEEWTKVDLKAWSKLVYLYLLLNDKIWVFEPNTKNYKDTKSLKYIWQIEWESYDVKDFMVNYDGELYVLNDNWLYKLEFQISDEKLIVK